MFRLVVEHRGTDPFSPFLPMAQLGLARALAAAGDRAGSRRAYETLMRLVGERRHEPGARTAGDGRVRGARDARRREHA